MCFRPTKEEVERSEAMEAARRVQTDGDRHERRDPWTYPTPRGNQERDERELERSSERLTTVLGH